MSYFDFCVWPRVTLGTFKFFQASYKQQGYTLEDQTKYHNTSLLLDRTFEYDANTYRIPLKSHRIWVTSPVTPRETLDVLTN